MAHRMLGLGAPLLLLLAGCVDGDATPRSPAATLEGFALPWTEGEGWFFVGGPHCDDLGDDCGGQPRYALDFAPVAPMSGNVCRPDRLEPYWVTAVGPGVVRVAERSLVEIEHENGRRSGYYHLLTSSIQVFAGDEVVAGHRLGHPSCEHLRGGGSRGAHVHFYFCQGKPGSESCLGDPDTLRPITGASLSGWRVAEKLGNYEGMLERGKAKREAVNLRCDGSDDASVECGDRRNDVSAR